MADEIQTYTCPHCGAAVEFNKTQFLDDFVPEMGPPPEQVTLKCQACYKAANYGPNVGYFSVDINTQQITFVHPQG